MQDNKDLALPDGPGSRPTDEAPVSAGSSPKASIPSAEDEPRLRYMGPMPGGGFGIELEGGPLHHFAAHLVELMTGPNGELWNCMETEVTASDGRGSFTLTVQRRGGKTPLQLKKETEERYNELLFAVSRKYPGEDRHATALRYIRERDSDGSGEAGETAKTGSTVGDSAGPKGIAQPIDGQG